MSLGVSRKRLYEARMSLEAAWRAAEGRWRDDAARRFHQDHLDELEPAIRSAMTGLSRMSEVLERARAECD